MLDLFRNVQIAPAVIVRTELALQVRNQLAQRLALFGHDIGQQQAIQHPVALGQEARIADATRLLAADQNVVLHHQICDVLESDRRFVKFAAVLGGDAVKHAGGIEGAHHVSRPLLALQQPAQQHAEYLVRVHEAAIFGDRADAVGIAIGGQTGIAVLTDHGLLQESEVWLDGFRIDARKQRVYFLADRDERNATTLKDSGKNAPAGAIH